jgi:hypothetical protein
LGVSVDYLVDDEQNEPPQEAMSDSERVAWFLVKRLGPERAVDRMSFSGSDVLPVALASWPLAGANDRRRPWPAYR